MSKKGDISVKEFKEKIQSDEVNLLDVRTQKEFDEGRIANSTNIDVMNPSFGSEVDDLDKDKTTLVYCRSGARSGSAMNMMSDMGFKEVYNLDGGIMAWEQAGEEIED